MSRRNSGRVRTLKDAYRTAAHKGDWQLCKLIAEQMRGLDGDDVVDRDIRFRIELVAGVRGSRTLPGRRRPPRNGFEDRETHRDPSTPVDRL